jgi:TolA-binding protein
MMRKTVFALATLLLTNGAFAASREQQEMQRDIAQLQDQVRTLQSGFDQKMAALQTLVQQALDAGNRANTGVSVLSSSVTQAIDRQLRESLGPVAGVSSKVENLNNDMAEVKSNLSDVNSQLNKVRQQLTDLNNAVRVIQAPPPAPPAANAAQGQINPPVPATKLFSDALGDYSSGKADLAVEEFSQFLKSYPDDPNASTALRYIGQTHMAQQKYDEAVVDFDTILERYPEGKDTRQAWFEKGMALKAGGHRADALKTFKDLVAKYKNSEEAKLAADEIQALGASVRPPVARKK